MLSVVGGFKFGRRDVAAVLVQAADWDELVEESYEREHWNRWFFYRGGEQVGRFDYYFKPALVGIGRDGVRIHDLRHFAGTQTARVANLVETMARLGHSTSKASLLYQQQVSGRDVEIAAALSKIATKGQKRRKGAPASP